MPIRSWFYPSSMLVLSAAAFAAQAPSNSHVENVSAADCSFAKGAPVAHPESLSGIWEAPDAKGGAVGILLHLTTTIPGSAETLLGTPQRWEFLNVALYQRQGPTPDMSKQEANSFSDSPRGGGVRFQDERLTLHAEAFDLDLRHTPADTWTGRFHRGEFDENVTLERPHSANATRPLIVGTWRETGSPFERCLHIFQTASGGFTGWYDTLQTWGNTLSGPGIPRPTQALENYGELVKVEQRGPNMFSMELNPYTVICCSHLFYGTLDGDNRVIANWPAGLNQSPYKSTFAKVPGDSCITTETATQHP